MPVWQSELAVPAVHDKSAHKSPTLPDDDVHRTSIPIDHPDGSITAKKLADLDYVPFASLTADPSPLKEGMMWFRSDTGELRWTPDGSTIYVIDPAPVVAKSWSDTDGHFFNDDPNYTSWYAYPAIQLDSPDVGHKRSFEDMQTGYVYVHGWLLKQDIKLAPMLRIYSYIGAYHGYNGTRAIFAFVISHPANIDNTTRDDRYPWVRLGSNMDKQGYANGDYGKPFRGYIVFTDPPTYSFYPADPAVKYNLITEIPNIRTHILYGYKDAWGRDWNQWASLQDTTRFRYQASPLPVALNGQGAPYRVLERIVDSAVKVYLIEMYGKLRLWVKNGTRGLVVPLAFRDYQWKVRKLGRTREALRKYDCILGGDELDFPVETSDFLVHVSGLLEYGGRRKYDEYIARVKVMGDRVYVIHGMPGWDGDKYGFLIDSA